MDCNLRNGVRELQMREAKPENVIAEVVTALEFARDFFEKRGKHIIAQNVRCQLQYFQSAEVFQRMQDSDVVPSTNAN